MFVLLLPLFLFAQTNTPSEIEIYAGSARTTKDSIEVQSGVVVIYGDYILTAKKAKYNRKSGILELFEDVKVSVGDEYKILGKYAKLNIKEKKRSFEPFYMLDKKSQVWMSGDKGCAKENDIDISSGVVSGCDPKDPMWQIEFSSSDYNAKTKWLNLYNTILYIYDIPILYTPYFGYSLDTTRRTGLLTPSFGYSANEGVYFEQPLYIAEQNWWDLEFRPQIRTLRGYGIYGDFRFVDSKYSKGKLSFGYFKEKYDYFLEYNLANQKHYGLSLDYTNSNFLQSWFGVSLDAQSVIYLEAINMNDVDYINLQTNDTTRNTTASQTLSRANIFYNSEKNYLASYFKYYVDLTKENNAQTLQQLPSLHYHRYLETLFDNHLLYNLNIKSNNLYRSQGTTAVQTNLEIPLGLRASLFDEYLNIAYKTTLYGQYSAFKNDINTTQIPYENGYYARNYHQFSLTSQLTKPYNNYIHSLNLSASYITSGFEKRDGFYQTYKDIDCADPANSDVCAFYKISDIQNAVTLGFSQYIFDKEGKQILYHRLSEIIIDPGASAQAYGELENELDYAITDHLKYYNNMLWNFDNSAFSKQFNKLSYSNYGATIALSHFYKKNFSSNSVTSYVTSSLNYRYNSHYSYKALYDYDLEYKTKKRFEIGFLYEKRCWNFGLRYAENNRPILTNNNEASSIYERYIYFTIVLKPIMKATRSDFFGYRLPKVLKGN